MLRVYIGEHHCDELLSRWIPETHSYYLTVLQHSSWDADTTNRDRSTKKYIFGRHIKVYNVCRYLFLMSKAPVCAHLSCVRRKAIKWLGSINDGSWDCRG
jgi:hypothetical protein